MQQEVKNLSAGHGSLQVGTPSPPDTCGSDGCCIQQDKGSSHHRFGAAVAHEQV